MASSGLGRANVAVYSGALAWIGHSFEQFEVAVASDRNKSVAFLNQRVRRRIEQHLAHCSPDCDDNDVHFGSNSRLFQWTTHKRRQRADFNLLDLQLELIGHGRQLYKVSYGGPQQHLSHLM